MMLPPWLRRTIYNPWFASTMMGFVAYNLASLFNDVADLTHGITSVPFWARIIAAVVSGLMVRLGLVLDRRRLVRL